MQSYRSRAISIQMQLLSIARRRTPFPDDLLPDLIAEAGWLLDGFLIQRRLLDEWRAAREAIFATPLDVTIGPALFARLGAAEHALMAAPAGVEPTSSASKAGALPLGQGAISGWAKLPIALRRRWWTETEYGKLAPSPELAAAVGLPCCWCGVVHVGSCGRMISGGQSD